MFVPQGPQINLLNSRVRWMPRERPPLGCCDLLPSWCLSNQRYLMRQKPFHTVRVILSIQFSFYDTELQMVPLSLPWC